MAVLFDWPLYSVGHYIQLAFLFGWSFYPVGSFNRLAVFFGWPFIRLAIMFMFFDV